MYLLMKSTYCGYILEKILSTSEVGPILALIAPSPLVENLTEINLCFYILYLFVCFKLQMKLVVLNL
jgi:hypothetical protein